MLTYFPPQYPNELLYSIISRYHHQSGNSYTTETLKDLFNTSKIPLSMDLPINLENMSVASYNAATCANNYLNNHTLYNFYTFFLNQSRRDLVKEKMLYGTTIDVHNYIGLKPNSIPKNKFLKYCPLCNKENHNIYGEYYWNRLFQIHGINTCPYHQVRLLNSTVPTMSRYKYFFYKSSKETCPENNSAPYVAYDCHKFQTFYDHLIKLNNLTSPIKDIINLRKIYVNRLIELGLAYKSGRVKQKEFGHEFLNYYGSEFLDDVSAKIDITKENNWLRSIVRLKTRYNHYPTYHLLLIQFLGFSLEQLLDKYLAIENSYISYPCLNKVCNHYLKPNIATYKIKNNTHGKYYYSFTCPTCEFTYCRYNLSTTDKYDFVKDYGPLWRQKLLELYKQDLSLRQISKILNVTHPTVKKQLKTINTTYPKQPSPVIIKPKSIKSPVNKILKDWNSIDQKIVSELIQSKVNLIKDMTTPIRFSKEMLIKNTGKRSYISQNLYNLPLCRDFLEKNSENVVDFYKRKADYIYEQLNSNDQSVSISKIIYNVNSKPKYQPFLINYLEETYFNM